MRRLALLAGALVVPVLPALVAAPAWAADYVICVNTADASCTPGQSAASINAAISLANGNPGDDTILVGPGTYTEAQYQLNGSVHALTLKGSGAGSTFLTIPDSASPQTYMTAFHATVQDLTITMKGGATSDNDKGLALNDGAVVERVVVDGLGTTNARGLDSLGSQVKSSSIQMPLSDPNSRGIYSAGGTTVTDSTIQGAAGFVHSGAGTPDTVSRVTIRARSGGVQLDSGTVNIDDSVIDLGGYPGTGLLASNGNGGTTPMTINGDHLTIVGAAGVDNSVGVGAYATVATAKQTATITLVNSIVEGPENSFYAFAGNNGAQSGDSVATITTDFTNWEQLAEEEGPQGGDAAVTTGPGNLMLEPTFLAPGSGNYRLSSASPLVDRGRPGTEAPLLDRDGATRVVDGNGDATAVRDMGAYEYVVGADTVAPDTTITGGPAGVTADPTPTFTFTSEAGATFECRVDAGAFAACTSPFTTPSLTDGAHTFQVRAIDAATNIDPTPATRSFSVSTTPPVTTPPTTTPPDTAAPDTTITKPPRKKLTAAKAKLQFGSEAGATFQCQLDGGAWKACSSPYKVKVKLGKHTILVRAIDQAGNVDATPAKATFKRVRKS